MAYWLMKSEPDSWSWDQQVKAGSKGAEWTGVRNHTAKQNLMKMKKGDRAFFYHTGDEKQVVGIGDVIREAFADPSAEKGEPWVAVQTAADKPLPKPVTLAAIKADPTFEDFKLVRQSRLSVVPVSEAHAKLIAKMSR